jgi:P2-related tail formation protein
MGVFWSYFKDSLHWSLIQAAGPLAVISKGLALYMDDVREDIHWLRDQLHPATCDETLVTYHGESRGITKYPGESPEQYRIRVVKAYVWQKLGSKAKGLPIILDHHGYPGCEVINVRKEDEARWAEFKVRLKTPESGLSTDDYKLVAWAANEAKPASSKLAGLDVVSEVAGTIQAGGITITSVVSRISTGWPDEATIEGNLVVGSYVHTVIKSTV